MLNHQPIFIHAYARGGSNIIMNLLLSHPDVCLSNGETHKVFKGTKWDPTWRRLKKRIMYDYPIRLLTREDFFNPKNLNFRRPVSENVKHFVDKIFYDGRFTTMIPTHNLYKYEGVEYTKNEIANCRLLTKGLNGIVFTGDMFSRMYPDATFFGLVRNGLAVCEGHVRRGHDAEEFGIIFKTVAEQIMRYSDQMDNYTLCFYEEMTSNPLRFMKDIYLAADLNADSVNKVRLQSKGLMQASGERIHLKGSDRQVFWHEKTELSNFVKSDINENQIRQLSRRDKNQFLSAAGAVMERLGYSTR